MTEQSYLSPLWYRLANLRPRLRRHACIHRNIFRGQLWYVLQDRASGRFHRFTPETYFLISLMDGERSMQEVWDIASEKLQEKVLTQDEVIQLLGQLHAADVLYGDVPPDIEELSDRGSRQRNRKLLMSFMNPLALRLRVLDPNDFLDATFPLIRPLLSWFGAILFAAVVGYGSTLAAFHWSALTENVADRVLSAENIVLLLLAYPLIKAVHELGHAYAVKRWGGDVHEIGIMLLVFMPVPYVEASDSMAFQSKWQRAFVGSAGILVEILLAAIAVIVWVNAEEGLARAFAFNVMLIGGVSTLLFNGNPLLKFDGYYVLSDIIEIPNLASRANQYIGYLIQRYAFKVTSATSPVTAPGEGRWLFFYSIASFCYRLFIMVAIVTFVSGQFFIIGTLIAIWAVILMIGVPLGKQAWFLLTSPVLRRNRSRAMVMVGSGLGLAVLALLAVPVPHATVVEGVVWLPGEGIVHAGAEGIVTEVNAAPDSVVGAETALMRLEDPLLRSRVALLELRVRELQSRLENLDLSDLAKAKIVREELRLAGGDLEFARKLLGSLVVLAETSGTLILPEAEDLVGRFIRRGDVVAYVLGSTSPLVRVIVAEDEADLVRNRTRAVSVRFAGDVSRQFAGEIRREVPALSDTLPSLALSTVGGGRIALDPRDQQQRRVLASLLHLDIGVTDDVRIPRIGSRVYVRFFHGMEPLAERLYWSLRQVFLRSFKI
jgi:putative peptide zinc metalloprotease protein